MGFNLRLAPYTASYVMDADPAADVEFQVFRFPEAGRVLAGYATNDAAIATATNTLAVFLTHYAGTALQGTIGSWAAGSTWAADIPRTMTVTSYGSTVQVQQGEHVRVKYDETTSGTWTRMNVQFDYILGFDL